MMYVDTQFDLLNSYSAKFETLHVQLTQRRGHVLPQIIDELGQLKLILKKKNLFKSYILF